MGMFSGKIGLVMGVANDHSIAWAMSESLYARGPSWPSPICPARPASAACGRLVEPHAARVVLPCDVQRDEDIAAVFEAVKQTYGRLDFLIHAVAFAPPQELRNPYLQTSRAGWHLAMDISVYSLVTACRAAAPLMSGGGADGHAQLLRRRKGRARLQRHGRLQGGLGTQRPLPGLGPGAAEHPRQRHQRRPDADAQRRGHCRLRRPCAQHAAEKSPLGRNVDPQELAATGLYLLGDLSGGVTGETIHVDCGYSIIGL